LPAKQQTAFNCAEQLSDKDFWRVAAFASAWWAERALKCGFPERFAEQTLGHNSKAVHRAYTKHAAGTLLSLPNASTLGS